MSRVEIDGFVNQQPDMEVGGRPRAAAASAPIASLDPTWTSMSFLSDTI